MCGENMINDKIKEYVFKLINNLKEKDYIGIIVYGSYVNQRNNNLSDLDVMIIKDNYDTQDIGSMIIDGVRVEYFIQDLNRLYKLIRKQIDDNDPSHLTKFVTSEIICDTDNKIKDFIDYSKKLYNNKITPIFTDNERFSILSISNRIEDLESLINDDSFYSVYYVTLEKIRTLYSKINGLIELPIMKCSILYTDNEYARKYISSDIHKLPNNDFINMYLECIKINDKEIMLNNIKKLFNYCFKDLGFDSNNFCLKFTKNPPFKV